jgi:hypothetical protein
MESENRNILELNFTCVIFRKMYNPEFDAKIKEYQVSLPSGLRPKSISNVKNWLKNGKQVY